MGRTGSLWAYEQLPVRPDVITAAKALGGGLPRRRLRDRSPELGDVLERGDHGSTFGGAPIAAASGARGDRRDRRRGAPAADARAGRPPSWSDSRRLDGVVEVRGRGLMVGVTLAEGLDAAGVPPTARSPKGS